MALEWITNKALPLQIYLFRIEPIENQAKPKKGILYDIY